MRKGDTATILAVHPGAELFGSDRMFFESVTGMIQDGHRVIAALPQAGDLAGRLHAVGAIVTIMPMLVLRKSILRPAGWPGLVRDSLRNLGAGWRIITRHRPGVLYVSTLTLPLWPVLGRARRMRVVSHIHEAESTTPRLVQKAIYLPHLLSSAVIVNSLFTQSTLRDSWPRLARKSEVIYNGVEAPSSISPPRTTLGASLRVLYLGRLSPRKGLDIALESIPYLRQQNVEVHLTFLGSVFAGYEWYERQLHATVRRLGLEEHVDFVGFDPDVWHRLADADVVIVPSIQDESFGNTAVEGVLAQRPVVASNTSGLREAAGDYASTLLVPPSDPVALSRALFAIYQNWSEFVSLTEASAHEANQKHSVDNYRSFISAAALAGHQAAVG